MNSKGFTLLELILSLTILAIIVMIVSGGFRIGIRAYEKGGQMADTNQRERVSSELIKHQLASLYIPKTPKDKPKETQFFFKGENKRISFLSSLAMIPGNTVGTVYAVYAVKSSGSGEKLVFYEKNISMLNKTIDISDNDFYDLIPEAQNIEFEYLRDGDKWLKSYDAETEKTPPKAVRIAIRRSPDLQPLYIIARILQTQDNEKKQ